MPWIAKISGKQIKDDTIKDNNIASDAAIQESKLALDHSTADLYTNAVRTDADRVINEGVSVTFPKSGFLFKDSVNGKTYRATLQNGVLILTEEP